MNLLMDYYEGNMEFVKEPGYMDSFLITGFDHETDEPLRVAQRVLQRAEPNAFLSPFNRELNNKSKRRYKVEIVVLVNI